MNGKNRYNLKLPTLFIGLGRTGHDLISYLFHHLHLLSGLEEIQWARFIIIDFSSSTLEEEAEIEFFDMSGASAERLVRQFSNRRKDKPLRGWYQRQHIDGLRFLRDWGGDRQIARALFLWHGDSQQGSLYIREKLRKSIQNMMLHAQKISMTPKAQIFVISSVGDGFGSGIINDIGYLIRDILDEDNFSEYVPVYGIFTIPILDDEARMLKERTYANVWATLSETDYLLHTSIKERRGAYPVYYFSGRKVETKSSPYTGIYLLDHIDNRGNTIRDQFLLNRIIGNVLEILTTRDGARSLFSIFSSEGNNRVASFGVVSVNVPIAEISEYLSIELITDALRSWLADKEYYAINSNKVIMEIEKPQILEEVENIVPPLFGLGKDSIREYIQNMALQVVDKWKSKLLEDIDNNLHLFFVGDNASFNLSQKYLLEVVNAIENLEESLRKDIDKYIKDAQSKINELEIAFNNFLEVQDELSSPDSNEYQHNGLLDSILNILTRRKKQEGIHKGDAKSEHAVLCLHLQEEWLKLISSIILRQSIIEILPGINDELEKRMKVIGNLHSLSKDLLENDLPEWRNEIDAKMKSLSSYPFYTLLTEDDFYVYKTKNGGWVKKLQLYKERVVKENFPFLSHLKNRKDLLGFLRRIASGVTYYVYDDPDLKAVNLLDRRVGGITSFNLRNMYYLWPLNRTRVVDEIESRMMKILGVERADSLSVHKWPDLFEFDDFHKLSTGDPYNIIAAYIYKGIYPYFSSRANIFVRDYTDYILKSSPLHVLPDFDLGAYDDDLSNRLNIAARALSYGLVHPESDGYVLLLSQEQHHHVRGTLFDALWTIAHKKKIRQSLSERITLMELSSSPQELERKRESLQRLSELPHDPGGVALSLCKKILQEMEKKS